LPQSRRGPARFARDSAAMMIRPETDTPEPGFCLPRVRPLGSERATVLVAELIATVALALSTLTVAAVVAHACVV
jgi:hypothetical protein